MLYVKYIQILSKKTKKIHKDIFILLELSTIVIRNKKEKLFIRKGQ